MIKGTNVNLRHVTSDDLPTLINLINDLSLRGEYLQVDMVSPVNFERKFAQDGRSTGDTATLVMTDKASNLIGKISYFPSVPYFSALEIGYHLFSPDLRNRGIATEAVRLMTDYLFSTKPLNRLEIRLDVRNIASEKVAVKCGFQKEGVAKGANFVRGKYVDMAVYALLRQEWTGPGPTP